MRFPKLENVTKSSIYKAVGSVFEAMFRISDGKKLDNRCVYLLWIYIDAAALPIVVSQPNRIYDCGVSNEFRLEANLRIRVCPIVET